MKTRDLNHNGDDELHPDLAATAEVVARIFRRLAEGKDKKDGDLELAA